MDHREHFKHPYWDQLNTEEKKAWLQAQIEKCLTEAGEEDDFLAACLEELDRMTPELSPSPQSVEMQLQKILSAPKPITIMSSPSICMPQLKKQLISALIACVLLIVLMPPLYADAIGQEIVNPYSPITAAHLSGKEMEHAAPIPQQNTEDTPKAIYRREKYRPKQDIGSYVYRSRDAFFENNPNFDLLYPYGLPEQYRIKYVSLDVRGSREYSIFFEFYGLMVKKYEIAFSHHNNDNFKKGEADEVWDIGGYTIYYIEEINSNGDIRYHAYHTHNNLRYHIVTTDPNMLRILLEHTFGP